MKNTIASRSNKTEKEPPRGGSFSLYIISIEKLVCKVCVCVCGVALFVDDRYTHIYVVRINAERCRREQVAVFGVFANCASSACADENSVGRGAGELDFAVLKPKRMNFRSLRSVEITVRERFRYGFVFELICFYHREAAEGIEFARADGAVVVVIVRCRAENSFSALQHFIVYLRHVIVVAAYDAAVVANFHCVHALVCEVVFAVFKRPDGVVVRYEKAFFFGVFNSGVDFFCRVAAVENGFIVKFNLVRVFFCVAEKLAVMGLVGLLALVGRKRYEAEVRCFCYRKIVFAPFVKFHFKSREGKEIFIL